MKEKMKNLKNSKQETNRFGSFDKGQPTTLF